MTLIGRFSMESESLANPSITSFFMSLSGGDGDGNGSKEPLTVGSMVKLWKERSITERHPRFFHIVSGHRQGYFEPSAKPLEQYITEVLHPAVSSADGGGSSSVRREIQRRIGHMQTATWDLRDALWHLYVAPGRDAAEARQRRPAFPSPASRTNPDAENDELSRSYVFFRAHHALADGASMVAAMMDLFDEAHQLRSGTDAAVARHRQRRSAGSLLQRLWRHILRVLWFLRGSLRGILYQLRLVILTSMGPNPWWIIQEQSSNSTSTNSPDRVISFVDAAAPLDQVKRVARHVAGPRATVNDVFVSCITSALAKQLQQHRDRLKAQKGIDVPCQAHGNVSIPVHLSGGVILPGESLGNRLGAFVVRLPLEATASEPATNGGMSSPQRLRDVHEQLFYMKQTSTPLLSHGLAKALSLASHVLPSSWISYLFSRSNAGSVAVVTNVRGPPSAIHLGGRKVESFHGFVPLPPGVPVGVVVGSYDNRVTLTLAAEPWAVPDGDQFLSWVLEEYLRLVEAASAT
jgi:WS/DGAT C-terminal domain/Wax ester synthase-like Acyl-CoA acyltransferase domain